MCECRYAFRNKKPHRNYKVIKIECSNPHWNLAGIPVLPTVGQRALQQSADAQHLAADEETQSTRNRERVLSQMFTQGVR